METGPIVWTRYCRLEADLSDIHAANKLATRAWNRKLGVEETKEEAGGHVLDESSWEPFAASKELYVGVPSMAELPVFVAEKVANAVRPEASWLGDNAVPGTPEYLTNAFADRIQALRTQDTGAWPANVPHSGSDRNWGLMIRCREGGHMWYKPWESDVVVLATQAPAAAKLTAQILKSVGADGDGGDGYGIASKILAMASAADRIRGNHCWSLTVAFAGGRCSVVSSFVHLLPHGVTGSARATPL